MAPRLSLCMIARNEERMLGACLHSVQGLVDEIIVVDTGSTDRTLEIARAAGARVVEQAWQDDFAFHRNEALAHATGDWVLQLDADERLAPGAASAIRAAIDAGGFDFGMLRLHDASTLDAKADDVISGRARLQNPVPIARLFRRDGELKYTGIIHEDVSRWALAKGRASKSIDADIIHLGAVPELRAAREKSRRNIDLLEKRCALEKDDHAAYGYLAGEYLSRKENDNARRVANEGWAIVEAGHRGVRVLRLAIARATILLADNDGDALLATMTLAEKIDGPQPDYDVMRGMAYEILASRATSDVERTRLLEEARAAHHRAGSSPRGTAIEQYVPGSATWFAHARLGTVLLMLDQPGLALVAFETSLALGPPLEATLLGRAEGVLRCGRPTDALKMLEKHLGDRPDGWVLASAAALALGQKKDAAMLLSVAQEKAKGGYLAPHRRKIQADISRALT